MIPPIAESLPVEAACRIKFSVGLPQPAPFFHCLGNYYNLSEFNFSPQSTQRPLRQHIQHKIQKRPVLSCVFPFQFFSAFSALSAVNLLFFIGQF
jgi:hypothetical protein